jgi:hypothetical protein
MAISYDFTLRKGFTSPKLKLVLLDANDAVVDPSGKNPRLRLWEHGDRDIMVVNDAVMTIIPVTYNGAAVNGVEYTFTAPQAAVAKDLAGHVIITGGGGQDEPFPMRRNIVVGILDI